MLGKARSKLQDSAQPAPKMAIDNIGAGKKVKPVAPDAASAKQKENEDE